MTKNEIPEVVQTIHLIAICGTGMGALACMLRDLGYEVTGSDQKIYPPMSLFLKQKGIVMNEGFAAQNLAHKPDLVIVGNAVSRDNPEVEEMDRLGLHFCSMPQALNRFVAAGKQTLLVSGTHGKTTTASILAWMLCVAGCDPSFMIGGILKNFDSNYRLGNGAYFVVEGDEYDTAFFDKGPKFLHFHPRMAVLTSVEFDHADIFNDLDHVKKIFAGFVSAIPDSSTLLAYDGEQNVTEVIGHHRCHVERYGQKATSPWRLGTVTIESPWTVFEVYKNNEAYGRFKTKLFGEHNLLNVLAVIGIADGLSIPTDVIAEALRTFEGIKRRQEVRGQKRDITVMDDFAHHPTAVRETVRAVKSTLATGRLIAVFEPRTNTSMRRVFQEEYPTVFDPADIICIRKPPLLNKIPSGQRFSSEQLVKDLIIRGKDAHYFPDTDAILDYLKITAVPGDLILVMSNGGFDNIHQRLLEIL
ncbi:MAG: UDP-N-acetylmuramate:L-alanyl-gamma-D-glutamyl-meso-diaminopimelate ligase [Deltaproteobacteria bacterium]|jgi:UDP-N-acetylmuramate: L-alanyl-gamma-D-glutamyl-meso-diaminopimelate ligase|nr:UDP-N-acetylmuramate:L-alanyl-gamma-D-glutamyl-meso-diaminopimelate ligase [Deltaproteobacteria bacterium]